jgi:K+-transporting ATPase ATPase C chain
MVIGSELLGHNFHPPYYFWPRPSATIPEYNPSHSRGSNLSPTNPLFVENIQERIRKLLSADGNNNHLIPIDLVTTSASGLDPHISVSAAKYQAARIARERQTSEQNIMNLIDSFIIPRQFGIFGENHLCVVTLNLQLDKLYPISHEQ